MKKRNFILTALLIAVAAISSNQALAQNDEGNATKKYDKVEAYKEDGFAMVRSDGKVGLIDRNGNEVIPCKYNNIVGVTTIYKDGYRSGFFSEGFACVLLNGKWGYIDVNGNEITAFKYDEIRPFADGMAMVTSGGKKGYINTSGNEVIPCKYDGGGEFSDGIASVKAGTKWIYIDLKGNEYATKKAAQKATKK